MSEERGVAGLFASDFFAFNGPSDIYGPTDSAGSMDDTYIEFLNSECSQVFDNELVPPPDPGLLMKIGGHSITRDLDRVCINDDRDPGIRSRGKLKDQRTKRSRSQNWCPEEKRIVLEAKLEALNKVKGKDWDFISQRLQSRNFKRSSKCCEDLWGTLLKAHRSIRAHESLESGPQTRNWVSYWKMDQDAIASKKLPRDFPKEWCKMIERILDAQDFKRKVRAQAGKNASILLQRSYGDEDVTHSHLQYLIDPGDTSGYGSNGQAQSLEMRIITNQAETSNVSNHTTGTSNTSMEDASLVKILAPLVKQQIDELVDSAVEGLLRRKKSGTTPEQDELMSSIAPRVKQQVETGVNYALQILVSGGCTVGTTTDEDADQITSKFTAFVRKTIQELLDSALQPISFILQVREQKQFEADEVRLRAIKQEKQALDREEKRIKRQRANRHIQCSRRASATQRGRRRNYRIETPPSIERNIELCQ